MLNVFPICAHLQILLFVLILRNVFIAVTSTLLNPELRLLHCQPQLVQTCLNLLIILHILLRNQQLDLQNKHHHSFAISTIKTCGSFIKTECLKPVRLHTLIRRTDKKYEWDLFEGLQNFGSLAEVFKDELKRARDQRRVVLHDEVNKHPQKRLTAFIIEVHRAPLLRTVNTTTQDLNQQSSQS